MCKKASNMNPGSNMEKIYRGNGIWNKVQIEISSVSPIEKHSEMSPIDLISRRKDSGNRQKGWGNDVFKYQ